MQKILLTDISVRALSAGTYIDKTTPGFGIRVGKNRKTWFTVRRGVRTTLGRYPTLTVQDARKKARLQLNGEPIEPRSLRFSAALEEFLTLDRWKESTRYEIERTLRRHFNWTKPLDKITHQDVAAAVDAIGAKSEAAHALKDLKTFFNWCVPRYIKFSPCVGIKADHKYTPRSRLITPNELRAIWAAANQMSNYGALVKILFTTGQRVGQLLDPDLLVIDEKQQLLTFSPALMKGNREHAVPYGSLTASLLPQLRKITNQSKQKAQLDDLCEVKNWVLHDARRFFSSTHAQLRTPIDITEALLSHVSGSRSEIQRVYDHYDRLPERRRAVATYEAHLAAILAASKTTEEARAA